MPETLTTDAPVTEISGVGSKTAERLRERGHKTAWDAAVAYLTTDGPEIADILHNLSRFHASIARLDVTNDALGVKGRRATDYAGMILLARMRDVKIESGLVDGVAERDHVRTVNTNNSFDTKIDGLTLRPEDVNRDRPFVAGADGIVSYGSSSPVGGMDTRDFRPAEEVKPADSKGHVRCRADDIDVLAPAEPVEQLGAIAGVDPLDDPSVVEVTADDHPVRITDDGVNVGWVAPRLPY